MAMTRFFDILFSASGLLAGLPLFVLLALIGIFDTGSPLFRQVRVGRGQRLFMLVKFRTMKPGTVSVATHLADSTAVTSYGLFLRRTKFDELPQLWNVFLGEMSLVGPRPCLPNQTELIAARAAYRVFDVRPGITGLAQINCIDMSTPEKLAATDAQMLKNMTLVNYFYYIFQTLAGKGGGDRIR